jgi:hypothetical protein
MTSRFMAALLLGQGRQDPDIAGVDSRAAAPLSRARPGRAAL